MPITQEESVEAALALPNDATEATSTIKSASSAGTFTRNSLLSVGRMVLSTAVSVVLPSFLIHRLPVTTYSAWVLILQMSAYVNYLDFGIQTGISKYVAEFEARNDMVGAGKRASAGLLLLVMVSGVGVVLTLTLVGFAPHLFHEMPSMFDHGMRLSLLFVGLSTVFALFCSIFASIFMGLQRYAVPMGLALANKVLFVVAVMGAVHFHGGLAVMGAMVALVNVTTGALHFVAWRRLANHVRLSLRGLDYSVVRKMMAYCSTLMVWTVSMLCISGLDVTIVGRYDFRQTAFYSIATLPTNLMLAVTGAALAPLMPAVSASSVHLSPKDMGKLLGRATRYTSLLLTLSALPLLVAGYWLLRVWVGPVYASQIVGYMRILVVATVLRNTLVAYANLMVATDSQRVAIIGAVAEAVVNLSLSVYLVRRIGAMGVAYGTLIGALVCLAVHYSVSMRSTKAKLDISRTAVFCAGLGRPLVICLPSLVLVPLWWRTSAPAFSPLTWLIWALSTVLLVWMIGLTDKERDSIRTRA